mgnify:FL=1
MENKLEYAITEEETRIADRSVALAVEAGASAVQVTLDKARTEIYALLDGELDNIRQTGDRALTFKVYADGRYGVFSTNRLEESSIRDLLEKAVQNVRMLAPDRFRKLPAKEDTANDAVRGDEMGLVWYGYDTVTADEKLAMAKNVSVFAEFREAAPDRNWKVVSEEVEYNNTLTDTYLTNSDGIHCRHTETSFEVCAQVTVEDNAGDKYSGFWWDYSISPEKVRASDCGHKAVMQAVSQIGPVNADGGRHVMVVSNRISGRLLQPVLDALGGRAIQQKSSFLTDSLGKRIFSIGLNIMDMPREKGKCGAILFEQDGRACLNREIITDGVVMEYFISTYMSGKLDMPATSECANRPVVKPFVSSELVEGQDNASASGSIGEAEIMGLCGSGILVTDFNGGNCNAATGDFSYGVDGLLFENGKVTSPICNMLITGNIVELWNNLIAAGNDPLDGMSRQVPTVAFKDVNFSS